MVKKSLPVILILLLAFALRLYQLTSIPPGLTHDEANHGREAIGILDGDLRFYFPLNYGSEPLYSYTVAGSMAVFGENLFALRLVNVLFGVAAIGLTYVWACQAFDKRVGLLTAVLMSISFWPLASSREALRAGMLPFFTVAAVWFFWHIVTDASRKEVTEKRSWSIKATIGFALCLTLTLHIYLAARVAWLMFPLFVCYLALVDRQRWRHAWRPTLTGLLLTGLFVIPMFVYLRHNPWVQTRLSMLDKPLQQIAAGEFGPTLHNAITALLAFVWPGYGDQFLAYNIPGRAVLDVITAVFFVVGLLTAGRNVFRTKNNAQDPISTFHLSAAFLLFWFFCGIIPSLITGPTANTTRNLAALPAVYVLAAFGFVTLSDWLSTRFRLGRTEMVAVPIVALVWLLFAGSSTVYDYLVIWGEAPEVRGAYQVTQLAMLDYLAHQESETDIPSTISTVYPGPAHDPSLALITHPQLSLRWTDARYALIWPNGQATHAIIPASTPPHTAFTQWLHPIETTSMRSSDLDAAFTYYELAAFPPAWLQTTPLADFEGAVTLQDAYWLDDGTAAGETAVLLTVWLVQDPARVGTPVPATETTDVVLFTQVLAEGIVLAQHDSLEAPSWDWQRGDVIVQVHPVAIPADVRPGEYQTIVGIYDRQTGARLSMVDAAGQLVETYAAVPPLHVINP